MQIDLDDDADGATSYAVGTAVALMKYHVFSF
jgi:hypothetical protein